MMPAGAIEDQGSMMTGLYGSRDHVGTPVHLAGVGPGTDITGCCQCGHGHRRQTGRRNRSADHG